MSGREEEVICLHREDINNTTMIGTCRICGQQRQYESDYGKPRLIRRGVINGIPTMVNPPSATPGEAIQGPETEALADVMPANWNKLNKVQKNRWFETMKEKILKDVEELGPTKARSKWGIRYSSWRRLAERWGFTPTKPRKRKRARTVTPTEPAPVQQPQEEKKELTPWPPPRRTDRTGVRGVYGF